MRAALTSASMAFSASAGTGWAWAATADKARTRAVNRACIRTILPLAAPAGFFYAGPNQGESDEC
jgi:hypothetical protein